MGQGLRLSSALPYGRMSVKKQRRKSQPKKRSSTAHAPQAAPAPNRRDVLRKLRNGGIAAVVLGAGGFFSVRSVQATIAEHDLTRIGTGTPAIVQIHDPSCPLCRALQKETRAALKALEPGSLDYIVADITTPEGRALATRHRVQHVTLLLMDGRGEVKNIISGTQDRDVLEDAFAAHLSSARR